MIKTVRIVELDERGVPTFREVPVDPPLSGEPDERVHHPFSPSWLQNGEACPPYQSKQNGPVHERTTAGTKSHTSTETRADDNELSDKDAYGVAECLDFYDRRKARLQTDYDDERLKQLKAADFKLPPPTELIELTETYLPIDDEVFEGGVIGTTAGYVDRAFISHDRTYAEMFDWKFGMWPVEKADNNLQGIAYSLGLFKMYPSLELIRFWFKQPHLEYTTDASFTRAMIPALELRIKIVVARAREARKQIAAGDWSSAKPMVPVCLFCAHLGTCDKVAGKMLNVAQKFSPLDVPENVTPSLVRAPEASSLLKKIAGVAAAWAKAVNTQLLDQVMRGAVPLPEGYKIITRADREIVDRKLYATVALQYMDSAEYETTLTPSLTAAEEFVSAHAPRGTKTAKILEFKELLEATKAVVKGDPYSFLKAVATKKETETTNNE